GALRDPAALRLLDAEGKPVPLQTTTLAHWPDGSVRWLLLDFLIRALPAGRHTWTLQPGQPVTPVAPVVIHEEEGSLGIETREASFLCDNDFFMLEWSKPGRRGMQQPSYLIMLQL